MAYITKRGNSYSVRYTYEDEHGKSCDKWESFPTKEEATNRKKQIEHELAAGTLQFQPMQRIPTKTPTVQKPCIDRALTVQAPIFRGYITKKSVKSYDLTLNIWCTSRTHIRTFLCFYGFPKSDRFRTFLIIKGNENLIIVEIDGIDEGIHQRLSLLRLGHIQLAETEQPSQSNFLIVCNIVELHIANMLFSCCTNFLPCDKSRPHSQIVQFWLADCRSTMWVYSPFRAYSSAGLPCSATMPPDSTTT